MVGVRAMAGAPLVGAAALVARQSLSTSGILSASLFGPTLTYAQVGLGLTGIHGVQGVDSLAGHTLREYWLAYYEKRCFFYLNNPWWEQ